MLFDLRGRGRRRTVQAIYLFLAILMGGGLVLFGVGGATPGGLVDAVTGNSSTSDNSVYEKRVASLQRQVTADPENEAAWAALAKAQVQQASVVGYDQNTATYTSEGLTQLRQASAAWQKYLALNPKDPDPRVASLMLNAYGGGGLNDPANAVKALETVITGRGGNAALYTQLAALAYLNGDTRKADIAEQHALDATPKDKRTGVKAQIAAERKQIDAAKARNAQSQSSSGTSDLSG